MLSGRKLKMLRIKRGLTQQQLGVRSRLHLVSISRIETSKRRDTSVAVASRLADALGCRIEDLLGT